MSELRHLTLADLEDRRESLDAEINRRHTLNSAVAQVAYLNLAILDAQGHAPGDPWRPPTGGHDAYPQDWTVTHDGQTWTSRTHCNTSEPGQGEAWEQQPTPDPAED